MTTYYIGPGGSDAANGLTWANRKLTLNGAEDVPVAAADTVYVGPGTYRELLTVDVSGTAGNPITYIGDYTGVNTDGVGGVVRVTGSDNDQTATRANCITATTKNYRTFKGFFLDTTTGVVVNSASNGTNWIINQCLFQNPASSTNFITVSGNGGNNQITNCVFIGIRFCAVQFTHSVVFDNSGNQVDNCLLLGSSSRGIGIDRVGGVTIKNTTFVGGFGTGAIRVGTALTVGQTVVVNNCIFYNCGTALQATIAGEIVENYNTLFGNATDRTNTDTGANSIAYPPLFDPRWAFQLMYAQNPAQVISPYDLASFSQLVNVAGTGPTTTDLRGTAVQGAQREWGTLEYDSALRIMAREAALVDGGGMVVT